MDWIFGLFFGASLLHMMEEYFYPGGFMDFMKLQNPGFAPLVTKRMAVIVNGLQLVICVIAMVITEKCLIFSMSVAALLFINAVVHIGGSIRFKKYVPGVTTGMLFYLPFSSVAYYYFISSGQLKVSGVIFTVVLGLLYQVVPIGYLALASVWRRV